MLVSLNKDFWLNTQLIFEYLIKTWKLYNLFLNPRYLSKESFFFIMNNDIKSPTLKCQLKLDVIFYAYVLYEKNQWQKKQISETNCLAYYASKMIP